MERTFIQTSEFEDAWKRLGLADEELRQLELSILKNTKIGSEIRGTGGLRKMRFSYQNEGKRGGIRVCYVDFVVYETIYLITAYSKSEKTNLKKQECNDIKKAIELLEESL